MNLGLYIVIILFIQLVTSRDLMVLRDDVYLHSSVHLNDNPVHSYRRLMCVSDRPKDAIIWNVKFHWINYKFREERTEFHVPELPRFQIDYEQQCRFNVDDKECFSLWSQKGGKWSIVHSYDVPMGPVYDSRWENFTELESTGGYKPITTKNGVNSTTTFGATGSIAFSVRGKNDAQIMICKSDEIEDVFCYNIIIGGFENKASGIRKCNNGIPQFTRLGQSLCGPLLTIYRHEPLSLMEWKTFVVTWEDETKTFELFDPDKKIFSYSDYNSTYRNSNKSHYIFYGTENEDQNIRFRMHNYSYTLTTDRGATLHSSPLILENSQELCIDMMVGLCKHCELTVNIVSGTGKILLIRRIRRSSEYDSIEHDLPMWQNEIMVEPILARYTTPVTLLLVTSVISEETDTTKDHWAIRNLEKCLPKGTVKTLKTTTYEDYSLRDNIPHYAICQRLSYNDPKSEMLDVYRSYSINSNNFDNCADYKIGPNCAIRCDSFSQRYCSGVRVCSNNSCTCAQGWQGSNCTTTCPAGSYGFGCSKKCSNCIDDNCHSFTGNCYLGCKSTPAQFNESLNCNTAQLPDVNIQVKSVTSTGAELMFSFPEPPESRLEGYNLTIKILHYISCENKENTPENLKITKLHSNIGISNKFPLILTDLVPYVTYEITVIAFNSKIGNKSSLIFSTKPRDIPTEVFTNISFSHNNLTWDNPVDCWTITGPIEGARIIITGVSEDVKNFSHSYDTKSRHLNLKTLEMYGNIKYQAKVYVLRELDKSINTTAYIDIRFTTDLSLPPNVPNLVIAEVEDSTIHLRWQKPVPPIDVELDSYSIRFLTKNGTLLNDAKVYLNETCYFWKNSFCKTLLLTSGKFVGTHISGTIPEIISITEVDRGVVYLKWRYPPITGGPLTKFIIFAPIYSTELEYIQNQEGHQAKVISIKKNEPEYSTYLYLLPSTRYGIFIQGATSTESGKLSTKMIETSSALEFLYIPRPVLENGTTLINIVIPPVINNTKDSQLYVIVKGPSMCIHGGKLNERMMEDIKVENYEVAWRVATFPTYETTNLLFTIGDDLIYDTVINCRLNAGSSYVIILLVHEKVQLNRNRKVRSLIWQSKPIQIAEIPKIHHASWAIPLILALLCIAVTMYFCSRRRRNIKYFDRKQTRRITEPMPTYPIIAETKNSQSSNCTELINQTIVTEHIYEEILDTVDAHGSNLNALPNSSERVNGTIATESKYDDASETVDVQNSTLKTVLNCSERINGTIATEPKYDDASDTVDVRRSNSKILPNSSKHINTTDTESKYDDASDTVDVRRSNSKILPNSSEHMNTTATESKYDDASDTVAVTTKPLYFELIDTVE